MHLWGCPEAQFAIIKGEELIKVVICPPDQMSTTYDKPRPMTHAHCTECGSFIYQRPEGAGFRALSPVTFQIETVVDADDERSMCGVSCLLPEKLRPTAHYNYENRVRNYYDDLPKYRTFKAREVMLTNEGDVIEFEEGQLERSMEIFQKFQWKEPEGMPLEASRALPLEEVVKLLDHDFHDVEHGYVMNDDMTWYVACRTALGKQCTGEMIDFWFSHVDDTERYKWWHPADHQKGTWTKEYFDTPGWKRSSQHYIGHRHIVTELIGGDTQHVQIEWIQPSDFGFGNSKEECDARFKESHVTACACGVVYVNDFPFGYLRAGYLVHMVKYDPSTGENTLRSRFWLGLVDGGNPVINTVGNTKWFRRLKLPKSKASGLLRHCAEEMHVLSNFLPSFYKRHGDKLRRQKAAAEEERA